MVFSIAYYLWLSMAAIAILVVFISTMTRKIKKDSEPLATKVFSNGIFFTLFMLASSIVIYGRTGISVATIISLLFFFGGIYMVIKKFKDR